MANFNWTDHINLIAWERLEDHLFNSIEDHLRPFNVRALQIPVHQEVSVGVDPLDVGEECVEVDPHHLVVVLGTHVEGGAGDVDETEVFIGEFLR